MTNATLTTATPTPKVEEHNECSPSQVPRILACPGSRRLKKMSPQEESSEYAQEGSMLHAVTEFRLYEEYGNEFFLSVPDDVPTEELSKEQHWAVLECQEYFDSLLRELRLVSTELIVELEGKTDTSYLGIPESSGTADVRIHSGRRLDIIDWKFGQGVAVSVVNNAQLKTYALGCCDSVDDLLQYEEIYLHVVQPRLDYAKSWMITGADLYDWAVSELCPGILRSRQKNAPCMPGEQQCRWCVGVTCRAYAEEVQATMEEVHMAVKRDKISITELTPLLEKAKLVSAFISRLNKECIAQCLTREGLPGYKLVEGRSNRTWVNERDANKWLSTFTTPDDEYLEIEDLFKTKLISPAQAEKLFRGFKKDENFQKLWTKPVGKMTLTTEADPRESIKSSAELAFKDFATRA